LPISKLSSYKSISSSSTSATEFKEVECTHSFSLPVHPFSTVNKMGFQKMLYKFESRYILPFSQNYIPEMYEKERLIVTVAMKWGLKYFSMTTNGWTSRANHNYTYFTLCILINY